MTYINASHAGGWDVRLLLPNSRVSSGAVLWGVPPYYAFTPSYILTRSRERHTMPPLPTHPHTPLGPERNASSSCCGTRSGEGALFYYLGHCRARIFVASCVLLWARRLLCVVAAPLDWPMSLPAGTTAQVASPPFLSCFPTVAFIFVFETCPHINSCFLWFRFCAPLLGFFLQLFSGFFMYLNDHRPVIG